MDKRLFFILLMCPMFFTTWATTTKDNDKEQQWSVKAGIGTSAAETESSNNRTFYSSPDASSNLFYFKAIIISRPNLRFRVECTLNKQDCWITFRKISGCYGSTLQVSQSVQNIIFYLRSGWFKHTQEPLHKPTSLT